MKKILSFFAIVALFSACEQDIQTNTPGFQAKLNDVQWRANNASVAIIACYAATNATYVTG